MPYSLINLPSPLLPIPVCLGPSMASKVPMGKSTLVSGIKVTLVRSSKVLDSVIPCLAFLPTDQPSFWRSTISCLPERTGAINCSGGHGRDRLNVWSVEGVSSYWSANTKVFGWFFAMEFDGMLFEEPIYFTHIFKGIQMERNSLSELPLRLWDRATKGSCTEFFATGYPSVAFFAKLKSDDYIARSRGHWPLSSFSADDKSGYKCVNINYTTTCQ